MSNKFLHQLAIENIETRRRYSQEFLRKSTIYFGRQPTFDEIIERIQQYIDRL